MCKGLEARQALCELWDRGRNDSSGIKVAEGRLGK